MGFGTSFTYHTFLPSRDFRYVYKQDFSSEAIGESRKYGAVEANAYIGDDWRIGNDWRVNAGVHASLFNIEGKNRYGISPRFSIRYSPMADWALKASYSRAVQYVHQLSETVVSLPIDQWVPICGSLKPQTSDNISIGGCWEPVEGIIVLAEGYYKWLHNLVDYRDDYFMHPPMQPLETLLTSGKGTAKGLDFKISRETGKITGHVAYSLMWADRTFADKNRGKTFPARFDNCHKINVMLSWHPNKKWDFNVSWTGMSGNRFTIPVQEWTGPGIPHKDTNSMFGSDNYYYWGSTAPFQTDINNYRLPFYHRMDLSVVRHTKRGFWTISLYNAYCNLNTISVIRSETDKGRPVFKKVGFIPIIPSFSYTWLF